MNEILNPTNKTYWLITDGNGYITGETLPYQQTTVGNGWNFIYVGTDQNAFQNACNQAGVSPVFSSTISSRQIRLWLIRNGISLQSVTDAIDSIEDPILRDSVTIEWEYAPYIERSHPMLVPLAQNLGLSESDIDRAFIEASLL